MAISTNGTVLARLAGALYNTQMSNATYSEVKTLDPAALANTLYARDFGSSTDLAVATTLVTNLGLSSVTGLANWVAAQLTAAGTANKGAKVVDLLNGFAQMTADTTYGAYATAFNTKVDAALVLSQTIGNAGGTFAAAGVVTVTNATFALTTGTDTWTSGAGDDAISATVATLGALDVIDGGAGNDTLSIADTVDVTSLGGATFKNTEIVTLKTSGNIGTPAVATATVAQQVIDFDTPAASSTVTLTVGSLDAVISTGADLAAATLNTATALKASLAAQGYTVATLATGTAAATADATSIKVVYDTSTGKVFITGLSDGTAVPAAVVKSAAAAANIPAVTTTAGAKASSAGAVSLSSFSTTDTVSGKNVIISAAATADVTATASAIAQVTGGKNVTATGKGGVTVKSAAGTVTATEKGTGAVTVEGGTSVTVTKAGATLNDDGNAVSSTNAGNVTVGADSSYSNTSVSADGYPELDANVKKQPTGNVTIKNFTDYTSATGAASREYGSGTATVYANGATDVSVATAGAITVKDVQVTTRTLVNGATAVKGTQTLASATIDGATTTAAITSDALTALKVVNTGGSAAVTVTNAKTGGHTLALTIGNNATGTAVTDDTATSVTVATEVQSISSAANASKGFVDLNAAVATSLTFNNAQAVELTGASSAALDGATKVTSIVATGAGALTLNKVADATKLTSIDASGAAGALKVTIPATSNYGLTVKGGSGADTVTLDGAIASQVVNGATVTTSVDLGAGNDTVLKGSSGSIGAGAYVNGGDGVDTIAATLLNAGNASLITNFEVLGLNVTSGYYDTDLLVGATGLSALALGANYTNVNTSQGITYGKDLGSSAGVISLAFGTAEATGNADAYSVTLAGKAGSSATAVSQDALNAQTLVIDNIEAVTVNSTGTGFIANAINLYDTKARTVTITGDKDLTITLGDGSGSTATFGTAGQSTDSNGLSLIDGSAATGKLTIYTNDAGVAYAGLTVKGGSNSDTISLAQDATVDAGAGNDTIYTAAVTSSVLTLGAGKDTVVATTTTYGSGNVTTITDLAVGDKLDFLLSSTAGSAVAVGAKVTLGSSVITLTDALWAAANSGGTTGAEINWFQYGGNTYIIFDAAASNSANISSSDVVVKLTGLVDLSTSTFDATQGLLIVA